MLRLNDQNSPVLPSLLRCYASKPAPPGGESSPKSNRPYQHGRHRRRAQVQIGPDKALEDSRLVQIPATLSGPIWTYLDLSGPILTIKASKPFLDHTRSSLLTRSPFRRKRTIDFGSISDPNRSEPIRSDPKSTE